METGKTRLLQAKMAAGIAASEYVQEGMLVGIGTGSTVAFFIEALGKRCRKGLKISAIASSRQSARLAEQLAIPLLDDGSVSSVDLTVDGADEIDDQHQMIKGGGGALLREKLLAQASGEMIVIIDETKRVGQLGTRPLPIEIARFCYPITLQRLAKAGYQGELRMESPQKPFLTDNEGYIVDLHYFSPIPHARQEHERLKSLTGVIETGLFFNVAGRIIVGNEAGEVKIYPKTRDFNHN